MNFNGLLTSFFLSTDLICSPIRNLKRKHHVRSLKYSNDKIYLRSVNFKKTFWYPQFLQKTNEKIRLDYYDTSDRLIFVRFLEEFEDTKKGIQWRVGIKRYNRYNHYISYIHYIYYNPYNPLYP